MAIAAAGEREAYVRLYGRESSFDSKAPAKVFQQGAGVGAEFAIRSPVETRYRLAVGISVAGRGLAVSSPFGSALLAATAR